MNEGKGSSMVRFWQQAAEARKKAVVTTLLSMPLIQELETRESLADGLVMAFKLSPPSNGQKPICSPRKVSLGASRRC